MNIDHYQFDLRNSALRRKYDGLKYTLKKLEVKSAGMLGPGYSVSVYLTSPYKTLYDRGLTTHPLQNTLYELSLVESANTETTPTAPHQ